MQNDIIYGKNSVIEALQSDREINKILISRTNHSDNKIEQIKKLAQQKSVVFQFVGRDKLAQYDGLNHQGVIAQVAPIRYVELEDFIEKYHVSEQGLSSSQAESRIQKYGPNEIRQAKSKKWYNYFLESLFSPFNCILLRYCCHSFLYRCLSSRNTKLCEYYCYSCFSYS